MKINFSKLNNIITIKSENDTIVYNIKSEEEFDIINNLYNNKEYEKLLNYIKTLSINNLTKLPFDFFINKTTKELFYKNIKLHNDELYDLILSNINNKDFLNTILLTIKTNIMLNNNIKENKTHEFNYLKEIWKYDTEKKYTKIIITENNINIMLYLIGLYLNNRCKFRNNRENILYVNKKYISEKNIYKIVEQFSVNKSAYLIPGFFPLNQINKNDLYNKLKDNYYFKLGFNGYMFNEVKK